MTVCNLTFILASLQLGNELSWGRSFNTLLCPAAVCEG